MKKIGWVVFSLLMATMLCGQAAPAPNATADSQPNSATDSRRETGASPTPILQRLPAEMPPNPPKVTCDGDKLTVSAQNSTLGAVLNAIRACTGAEVDVPEDAREERLFAELGPGPIRAVLADFLSSMDFNYVIEASPSDPQKVQMVLLNPRTSDSAREVGIVADSSSNMTPNRRGWLKARENYAKSFTAAAQDDSNQQADTSSSAPIEATASGASSVPLEATAPGASSVPVEAAAPGASSVLETEPSSPASAPVPAPAADPIASASTGSDTGSGQGKTTQELISNMQRMFEQRKQMNQQQVTPVH
jgi:hypothetical protein